MKTKNSILYKTSGGNLFSGSGMHRSALHQNLRDTMSHTKAETSVNNAVFGKILGTKKDNDSTKIGTIGSGSNTGEPKHLLPILSKTDDISDVLKKISFKENRKKNNIALKI